MGRLLPCGAPSEIVELRSPHASFIGWEGPLDEIYLNSILNAAPDGIVAADEQGRILLFSMAARKLFGIDEDSVVGHHISTLTPSPGVDPLAKFLQESGAIRSDSDRCWRCVISGQRYDGTQFPLQMTFSEVMGPHGTLFTGFLRDLSDDYAKDTRLREMQEELLHALRLSDMGRLVAAVSHELNQPLAAVCSYLGAASRLAETENIEKFGTVRLAMNAAGEQAQLAGRIIRSIRSFVRKSGSERRAEDPAKLIEEAVFLALLGKHKEHITATLTLSPDLPRSVTVDRVQLQQVVINLVNNAVDAVSGQPLAKLHVSAGRRLSQDLEILVEDNGPGLAPEIVPKLFQRFITTKPDGIGLGLSICQSIIEAHQGKIEAQPRTGGGTVFRIVIPTQEISYAG